MNSVLLANRPEDATKEEFQKAWDNSSYVLEALWKTLNKCIAENQAVKAEHFDCPNHYARLAFQAGQTKAYEHIISMLPQSAKPK